MCWPQVDFASKRRTGCQCLTGTSWKRVSCSPSSHHPPVVSPQYFSLFSVSLDCWRERIYCLFPPVSLSFLGHLSFGFLLCFVLTFFSLDLPCLLYVQRDRGCHSMASQRPREQSTWGKWYVILEGCIDFGPFFWNPQLELQALWCCKVLLIQCICSVVDVFGLMVVVYWSKGDGVFGLLVLVYLISMW